MKPIMLLAVSLLIGCSTTEQSTSTANGWTTQYSHGVTLTQSPGGFTFTFPQVDGVHYIVKPITKLVVNGSNSVVATFTITGSKFVAAGGGTPRVRFYVQRKGDDMMATKGTTEFFRWWSNPQMVALRSGELAMIAPIKPQYWSSVYGKFGDKNVKAFNDAFANLQYIGLSFGDDFGFGHGTWAIGKATFTLSKFSP